MSDEPTTLHAGSNLAAINRKRGICRRAVIIAICLLIGAVANVVAAWGLRFTQPEWTFGDSNWHFENGRSWIVYQATAFGRTRLKLREPPPLDYSEDFEGFGSVPDWSLARREYSWGENRKTEEARGFPLRCLVFEIRYRATAGEELLTARPISAGLIVDTLCYGAVAWTIGILPFTTRRRLRRRRGLCLGCAYDLRGAVHEVCPECGLSIA